MNQNSPKTTQAALVFILTFFSYAGLHALREGWSYTKPQIEQAFHLPSTFFGLVDTLYLVCYSFGMATIGNLSTKIPLRYFISVGMILASLSFMSFALFYQSTHSFNQIMVIIFMCLNGFFQSTGWPGVIGVMGNWFGKGKRGLLMGMWGINANIGNIIASVLCNILEEEEHLSWTYNIIFTGCFCAIVAIVVLLFLEEKPKKQKSSHILEPDSIESESSHLQKSLITEQQNEEQKKTINVFTALCLPRVPYYVIGYASLKGCIYGLLFWLPTYLQDKNLSEQKGYIAAMVDVGSFIGGLIVGYLGDKYGKRALFLSPCLFLSSIIMFIVSFAFGNSAWMYYIAMLLIGLLSGGPYNIIGSAITIDLGEQAGKKQISKVSALIEGSGALFAALSQLVLSILPNQGIFYLFSGQCILGGLVLLPLFLKDYHDWKYR